MNLNSSLDKSLTTYNLLESKFYVAWSRGELPVSALATYAREYGAFISLVPRGWAAHGDVDIAAEEVEHVDLWNQFAGELGTKIGSPENAGVKALVGLVEEMFSDPVTSLGALYAFEAQQPKTSTSKLQGLHRHYTVTPAAKQYFEIHAADEHEPALLLQRMEALSPADQERAQAACEATCRALREALDALYDAECPCTSTCH